MLSERQLARGFTDHWRNWTPRLDAEFLAELKPRGVWEHHTTRWFEPIESQAPLQHYDVVAEIAFGVYCESILKDLDLVVDNKNAVQILTEDALSRLAQLRGGNGFPLSDVSSSHFKDAFELARRLKRQMESFEGIHEPHLCLEGAGVLSPCHPDIITHDAIIEVKMSKTSFRSTDVRQLVLYAAMAYWSEQSRQELALLNPRLGLSWRFEINELIERIADTTPDHLFHKMKYFLTETALG